MNFNFTYWRDIFKVIALLFIYCYSGIAQHSLRNFTEVDGLPSSEVYDVLQATDGSMWFATDRGVSNYNGYEFVNYSTKESLTNNVIFEIYEDYKGRIWFLSSNNQISFWENGQFKEYPYKDQLEKILTIKSFFHSFHIDNEETVYLGTSGQGLIKITKNGILTNSSADIGAGVYFKRCENTLLSYSKKAPNQVISVNYFFENEKISSNRLRIGRTKAFINSNNLFCYNFDRNIVLYDWDIKKIIDKIEFDRRIVFIKWIDTKLYVGLESGGLQIFKEQNGELIRLNSLLKNVTCSGVAKDNQEGLWITTIEKGVFYCPNLNITSYTKENGLHRNYIKYLKNYNDKLVIGYGESYQFLDENNVSEVEYISLSDPLEKRMKLFRLPNSAIFSKSDCILYLNDMKIYNECTKFIFPHAIGSGFQVKVIEDDLYICVRHHFFKYSKGAVTSFDFERYMLTMNDIEHIDNDDFWIGFKTGLSKFTSSGLIDYSKKNDLFSNWIVDLTQTEKHGLVLATREAGVLFYKDDKITTIDTSNGLVSNDIIRLYADEEEAIWVATNKGLHRIDPDDSSKIDFINISDGILSNEIKDICRIDNNLYIGTKMGLSIVDLETFVYQSIPTEVAISNIILNKDTLKNISTLDINSGHKYLEINYLGINYPSQNDIEYKYKIHGLSDTWYFTKGRQIKLFSFPEKGSATLEVYAKTGINANWNEKPATIKLRFHPPFYKRWEFRFVFLSLLGLIIYAGFKINLLSYNKLIQQELYNRLLQRLKKNSYLIIKVNAESIRINYNDILYMKSSKDYVEIYTGSKKYLYRSTMKNMEAELSGSQFMRVHRSYIVKKDKIDSISSDQLAIGNLIIPIGKTYKTLLKEFAMQFPRLNR